MTETQVFSDDFAGIEAAARVLRSGGLVAFPTETVYGLGADARDDTAVAKIYEAKGRPSFNPLIVHVADIDAAREFVEFDETAERLASAFWPGPVTLVLPSKTDSPISRLVSAGLNTLAIRVPENDLARALLRQADCPVAAPSANPSGRISATTAAHVLAGLDGRIDVILDGGKCAVGLESTILSVAPRAVGASKGAIQILRPGGMSREDVEAHVGSVIADNVWAQGAVDAPSAPGQLVSHYAPTAGVRLNAEAKVGDEVMLGFGGTPDSDLDLSPTGDLLEAAANLFAMLHVLDGKKRAIAVAPIPKIGLGLAINDRLNRAAAPR